jgi:dethiobiotin synthetase
MSNATFFITGISTDVGKTVASAIITRSLDADYWKPVQAGDLHHTDSAKVAGWVNNSKTVIHPSAYTLNTPMSPHAAAEIDGLSIKLDSIVRPGTDNILVIEGAGGLMVPLNDTDCIIDLIDPMDRVVLVSRHYLGSINHTLLSIAQLQQKGLKHICLLFVGNEHPSTESIILYKTGVPCLGRIGEEPEINAGMVKKYAESLRPGLISLL